jgi:hypothetical protein
MFGSIKKIFASIFGIFGAILKLPITLITLPLKLLSSNKETTGESAPKKKKSKAFYLEATDAKGVPAPAPAANPNPVPAAATATALNLPQPTVTVSNTPAPTAANNYTKFGPRRRPGANMKSYLDMAKTIKSA